MMQVECVIQGDAGSRITVRPGFLHLIARDVRELAEPMSGWPESEEPASRPVATLDVDGRRFDAWQEASEQHTDVPSATLGELCVTGLRLPFTLAADRWVEPLTGADRRVYGALVRTRATIDGRIELCATPIANGASAHAFTLTARIVNVTPVVEPQRLSRDEASLLALVSCHMVLGVEGGAFASSIDPPDELAAAVAGCNNIGLWPVLAGAPGQRETMLAAPIILYDYPQVAPESAGDLFDATEIDEILTLRILTMTDDEKREMLAADERARALLERTERLTAEQLQRLHGTLREVRADAGWAELDSRPRLACLHVDGIELKVGDRVLLHPHARADIFDLALRDQVATIESIERDFEDHVHVAVTVDCDPGRDFGLARMPGHRFFFAPDELEPVRGPSPEERRS